ncbi:hypothetical protein B0H13DRAFT_2675824 [Mycena leptocephala]|nr:hypothetical protein B0H13DRAFT_2675824 [Mycena leptocephala]
MARRGDDGQTRQARRSLLPTFTTVRTFCISVGQHGAILLGTIAGFNLDPPAAVLRCSSAAARSAAYPARRPSPSSPSLYCSSTSPLLFALFTASSRHSTPFRQAKLMANHNNGQPRSAQHQIHAFELSLTMNPAILNLSLDHNARDTQYLTPQTNISGTSHATESVETYGIRSVSLVCVFHFVPAAFSLGAPVFIVLLAGSPYSLVLGSASAAHAHPDDSGTTRQGLGIGVDVIRPRRARNRRLYGTYLRPLGVALPGSLRALRQHNADAAKQHPCIRARAFAGAQGNAEAREQARPAQALSPTDTPHFRTQRAAFLHLLHSSLQCEATSRKRARSRSLYPAGAPPVASLPTTPAVATNTARHDTVDIPGRVEHTHVAIRCGAGPLDHRVLIDAPRHAPTITPPPIFKSRSLHACGRNLRSTRAPPSRFLSGPTAQSYTCATSYPSPPVCVVASLMASASFGANRQRTDPHRSESRQPPNISHLPSPSLLSVRQPHAVSRAFFHT